MSGAADTLTSLLALKACWARDQGAPAAKLSYAFTKVHFWKPFQPQDLAGFQVYFPDA